MSNSGLKLERIQWYTIDGKENIITVRYGVVTYAAHHAMKWMVGQESCKAMIWAAHNDLRMEFVGPIIEIGQERYKRKEVDKWEEESERDIWQREIPWWWDNLATAGFIASRRRAINGQRSFTRIS